MNNHKYFAWIVSFCLLLPVANWSQTGPYQLPTDAAITGIDFYNANRGIITTSDSLVFIVEVTDFNNVEFTPINVRGGEYSGYPIFIDNPHWLNDSTVFIVITEEVVGNHYLKMSRDAGRTWTTIEQLASLDIFGDFSTVGDSLFIYSVQPDLYGSVGWSVVNESGEEVTSGAIQGNYSWVFTPINSDTLLIPSFSDSLMMYSFSLDTAWGFETSIGTSDWSEPVFKDLTMNEDGVLAGARRKSDVSPQEESVYVSHDSGRTWIESYQGSHIGHLKIPSDDMWWFTDTRSDTMNIFISYNQGAHWGITNWYVDYSVFTSAGYGYWVGGDSGRVLHETLIVDYVIEDQHSIPASVNISAFPNPFNNYVQIRIIDITPEMPVTVDIYNILGQRVTSLYNAIPRSETLQLRWDTKQSGTMEVGSGVYFVRAQSAERIQTHKLMLIE